MQGETQSPRDDAFDCQISIHSPHAGRDKRRGCEVYRDRDFNPLAPCGARLCSIRRSIPRTFYFNPLAPCGARRGRIVHRQLVPAFQSTRPMRGETHSSCWTVLPSPFQSTRPMRGETLASRPSSGTQPNFNPLAPCGARRRLARKYYTPPIFQSTRPMRGETVGAPTLFDFIGISIHSPHAGRDFSVGSSGLSGLYFNPLAPCGARRHADSFISARFGFQSTRPMRGETMSCRSNQRSFSISIHSPHAGRDSDLESATARVQISIHSPHAGRDSRPIG